MKNQKIIGKVLQYIIAIEKYTNDFKYSDFINNKMLVEACVFNLIQIGESINKLDSAFIDNYQNIPWYKIRGLRNRIVHDYEGINLKLIWQIIEEDLPELKKMMVDIIE